ncbi:cytochrome c biogenesis protein CcdA [Eggerthellaceae bacterium zg-997]|nr:cytochrome c biogenesis protein CcdA [Eggerthellaceae bacterium zg-997]
MTFVATFLEGVLTFISPCHLPMLPILLAYFAGSSGEGAAGSSESTAGSRARTRRTLLNALGFICGFTIVFVVMGALAGSVGSLLVRHSTAVNLVSGVIVVLFGLSFAGVLRIPFLQNTLRLEVSSLPRSFPAALLFGMAFSLGWSPCSGAYLGSALLLAGSQSSMAQGVLLLLAYSAGLGIPYLVSALAIDRLSGAFDFIKRHFDTVNRVCGALLVLLGVLMMTGQMTSLMQLLNGTAL